MKNGALHKLFNYIERVNPFILLGIGFFVGIAVMYLFSQQVLSYQGKTAEEWAGIANVNSDMLHQEENVANACEEDPSSNDCNPILNAMLAKEDCSKLPTSTSAAVIYWRYKNCSSPISNTTQSGLKTIKGMNCQPTGNNDGSMNCQEYQYQYNPNATPVPFPSDMLMQPVSPIPTVSYPNQ